MLPDNESAWRLFIKIGTQWRTGMSGCIGLDYNPLFVLMGKMRLDDEAFDELLDSIRVMESEALKAMRES